MDTHRTPDPAPDPAPGGTPARGPGRTPARTPAATVGLDVSQQKYLSARGGPRELHAIVTLRVDTSAGGAAREPVLAEVLIVDCSSSMDHPEEKLRAAKNATLAALRMLPDGTPFAVVKGAHDARMAYPATETMATADAGRRAEAERAVHGLHAAGGTCVGHWLDLSRRLLAARGAPISHALMLTDGRNEHDDRKPLAGVLDACDGRFLCDAWGIGDGWDAQVLLRITRRLHGSADAVREESALPGEYCRLMRGLLAKALPELVIRVTPSPGATVRYLTQVHPTETPLAPEPADAGTDTDPADTDTDTAAGDRTAGDRTARDRTAGGRTAPDRTARSGAAFVTRAWGTEVRRYHLCLALDPAGQPRAEDLQAAVVEVELPGGEPAVALPQPLPCVVQWTDDPVLSERADGLVTHFRAYQQLGAAVARAAEAYGAGRTREAEECLGLAVALAHSAGATPQLAALRRLVDIQDAAGGRVVLRPGLDPVDFQHLMTASSHSTYGPGSAGAGPEADGRPAGLTGCPHCGKLIRASARFCQECGRRVGPV